MRYFIRQVVSIYLALLAKVRLFRSNSIVVAVTGITRKTKTKLVIYDALRSAGLPAMATKKTYNTETGLPLAVLEVEPRSYSLTDWIRILCQASIKSIFSRRLPHYVILELGISDKGDMKKLLRTITPQILVITDVVPTSFSPSTNLNDLTNELRTSLQYLPANGLALLNKGNEHVATLIDAADERINSYVAHDVNDWQQASAYLAKMILEFLTKHGA